MQLRHLPKELRKASMIGFRNLLVNDYASINLNLVYEFLQKKLPDFENFIKHIAKWLEKLNQTSTKTQNHQYNP